MEILEIMKDLTIEIEEKAKRYDEALEKARRYYDEYKTRDNILYVEVMEDIFSELKESEDERIRKELISLIKETHVTDRYYDLNKMLAWLEKQGEKKPADKVKPKFKISDWIVTPDNKVKQIEKVTFGNYWFTDESLYNITDVDNKGHLWTIQDAKEGDILADNYSIIIFRKIGNEFWSDVIDYYISYSYSRGIIVQSGKSHYGIVNKITFKPATKEQCDLLFSKMKEAGYEWDAEKKELKKIEQKLADKAKPKFNVGDWVINKHGFVMQIVDVQDSYYVYMYEEKELSATIEQMEDSCHLWTIRDAKDGDVLCSYPTDDYPWIGIFRELNDDYTFKSYCFLQAGITGKFCPPSGVNIFNRRNVDGHNSKIMVPATQEQRDLLFQKMKDDGYEWDAKDKVLVEIKQKPTWSEEDERMFECVKSHVEYAVGVAWPTYKKIFRPRLINWLTSIKERVQQQPTK